MADSAPESPKTVGEAFDTMSGAQGAQQKSVYQIKDMPLTTPVGANYIEKK